MSDNPVADLQAAVTQVRADVAAEPSISGMTVDELNQLGIDIETAQGCAETCLSIFDQLMQQYGNGSLYVSGTNPQLMIANLNGLAISAQALAQTFDCSNKLTRLGNNVAAVAAGGP